MRKVLSNGDDFVAEGRKLRRRKMVRALSPEELSSIVGGVRVNQLATIGDLVPLSEDPLPPVINPLPPAIDPLPISHPSPTGRVNKLATL